MNKVVFFVSPFKLQPRRLWWHRQLTHLCLTESMYLGGSPMEMWSQLPLRHWQIFSCSWKSTHLPWVKLLGFFFYLCYEQVGICTSMKFISSFKRKMLYICPFLINCGFNKYCKTRLHQLNLVLCIFSITHTKNLTGCCWWIVLTLIVHNFRNAPAVFHTLYRKRRYHFFLLRMFF